jgi:UDP-N-acetylglucosamine:LPS N-acetylglucosamine transferase
LLPEPELSGEKLCEEIDTLRNDRDKLAEMAENARKSAPMDATDIIYYSLIT